LYGNAIRGQGTDANIAQKGIQIAFGATGTVEGNAIADHIWAPALGNSSPSDIGIGLLIFASEWVNVADNIITTDQIGIASQSDSIDGPADNGYVVDNAFAGTVQFDGIDLCSNKHLVKSNTFFNSTESAIFLDDQCGTTGNQNIVLDNTINEACAGILIGPNATKNSISYNSIFNAVSEELTADSAVCSLPPALDAAADAIAPDGPRKVSLVR
jgi:Periplasmic copper-binding protein (NosD)